MVGGIGGGAPPPVGRPLVRRNAVQNLGDNIQANRDIALRSDPTGQRVDKRSLRDSLGVRPSSGQTEVQMRKKLTSTDDMLRSIETQMSDLGLQPETVESRGRSLWNAIKKTGASMFSSLIKGAVGIVKWSAKLTSNIVRYTTRALASPLHLLGKALDNDTLKGIDSKIDAGFKWFNRTVLERPAKGITDFVDRQLGLAVDENEVDANRETQVNSTRDTANETIGIIEGVGGVYGQNIIGTSFSDSMDNINSNINEQATQEDYLTTGNDGDTALDLGAAFVIAGIGDTADQIAEAYMHRKKGEQMIHDARIEGRAAALTGRPGAILANHFLEEQGHALKTKGTGGYLSGASNAVRLGMGGVNLIAGSARHGAEVFGELATGVANITQLGGDAAMCVVGTVECVIDSLQSHASKGRVKRCNDFLDSTVSVKDGKKKVAKDRGVIEVRDSVKLFKKNQKQVRKHKIFTAVRNAVIAAGSAALIVGATMALAATPVGWAVAGAAICTGIGVGIYKAYKANRRKANIQAMKGNLAKVQQALRAQPPPTGQRKQQLEKLQTKIKKSLNQTDPGTAAQTMIRVLNSPQSSPEAKNAARTALKDVFQINPDLFKMNPDGRPFVGDVAHREAVSLLTKKLGIFYSSVRA